MRRTSVFVSFWCWVYTRKLDSSLKTDLEHFNCYKGYKIRILLPVIHRCLLGLFTDVGVYYHLFINTEQIRFQLAYLICTCTASSAI